MLDLNYSYLNSYGADQYIAVLCMKMMQCNAMQDIHEHELQHLMLCRDLIARANG